MPQSGTMHLQTFLTFVGLLSPTLAQRILPGAYIAEIKGANSNDFLNKARSSGIRVRHRLALNQETSIFNGVSFDLEDDTADNRAIIESWGEVVQLSPVRLYDATAPVGRKVTRDVATLISRQAENNLTVDAYPPHLQGNVNKLRAEGLTGSGIKIAVVDTGIDYTHPSLGGKFGPGNKVAFGTDLVGNDYTGENIPVPGQDPMDCAGHGTHVAGIIAAMDKDFTGVSPDVTLGAYRVFGCPNGVAGSASNDVLISAFLQAQADGADLITASIGGPSGWTEDPWALVVQRIVEAGTPCTIAAGNEGDQGLFYASGAADAIGAISVASINNLNSPEVLTSAKYSSGSAGTKDKKFGYTPAVGTFGSETYDVYVPVANGQISDGCAGLPDDATALEKKMVVIRRGSCTFDDKVKAAVAKGAKNVIIVNNVPGTIQASVTVQNVNVGMVEPETGDEWLKLVTGKDSISVTFDKSAPVFITAVANPSSGGSLSIFTTWGPTNEMYQRPHIGAPGGNILSTYPLIFGGYAVLSGTSMATPYVAGVIGLYLEKAKKEGRKVTPAELRVGLTTTGRPLVFNDGTKNSTFLAPVAQQGGGLVDAYKFLNSKTVVDTDLLEFNDTQNFHRNRDFKITNNGQETINYKLTAIGGATAYTLNQGSTLPSVFPPDMLESYASVTIEPSDLSVKPGQSKRVVVTVAQPAGIDSARVPVYGGWINITPDKGEDQLSIPYMGIGAAMKKATVTNFEQGFPILLNSKNQTIFVNGTKVSQAFPPGIAWGLALGSGVVRIDVVSVSAPDSNDVSVFTDKTVGSFPGYPSYWNPRTEADKNTTSLWRGRVVKKEGDQSVRVPAGTYKFVYRALKMTGRKETGRDYERWESPSFDYNP
ncbi:Cucumisin [Drechslerella dactyloides]|uniref:Cucumisin n=1 Tax=Drechslerella dactyloides TaxID=74499 RepID=A0AAD6IWM9_DREDA|nr:Cucumisin [Drechslerella dactyloides]